MLGLGLGQFPINRRTNTITIGNADPYTETYTYDDVNRLTRADYSDTNDTGYYWFDAMGNRTSDAQNGQQNYYYDNANRLTSFSGGSMTYDANGNTLSSWGPRTFQWDSQNRMRQCVWSTTTSAFTYGPDGLRRSTTYTPPSGPATTTHYFLDGQSVIMELQDVNSDGNFFDPAPPHSADAGEVKALYCAGPRGIEFRLDASGNRRWYLYDGLGSVLAEVDDNGTMTYSRKMDVYGQLRDESGTTGSKHHFCGSLGHQEEDSVGLIYMRARWYDAWTGRFISEDRDQEGPNLYSYCAGNPVNLRDPSGNTSTTEVTVASTTAAGLGQRFGSVVWTAASNGLNRIGQAMSSYAANQMRALGYEVEELGYTMSRTTQQIMWRIDGRMTLRLDFSGHNGMGVHWNIGDSLGNSLLKGVDPHLLFGEFGEVLNLIEGML